MNKRMVILAIVICTVMLVAQTSGPSSMSFTPIGASTGCVASTNGDVLCAASDGFYISIAGAAFQKVQAGPVTLPTTISCTTASIATGTTGSFAASGCTLK